MAESQPDPNIFSVRIVSIDHYMAPPIPGMDICYSSFQGGKVNEVPVIRIYGSTPAGQKTCLHVHKVLPYLYVPYRDISPHQNQEGDVNTHAVSLAIEKALKLKGNAGLKRQHVHGCSLVCAKKFYGYHSSEEIFVKIYLYYPHDVSRASDLLLSGAVLDRSIQPHESHIPFILQFLVDYNLYGMGHIHLSKMKFRHPVPDVFFPRKFKYNAQLGDEVDKLTCMSADIQADSNGDVCLAAPVWVSSRIPYDWMWESPGDASSSQDTYGIKRLSVCELEGDTSVDDILNQQFLMYTALSQAHSDVKMVQSLLPIWEEEYERTGVLEGLPPDPGKPLPNEVLKALSSGCELESKLAELCCQAECSPDLTPDEKRTSCVQSMTSVTDERNIIEVELANSIKQPLECAEEDIVVSVSPQGLVHEEEDCAVDVEGREGCSRILSVDQMQSPRITGSLDHKHADKEALGILNWLASSQAAEEINSDDELVRATILSPLLPATTIDKMLEKANMEYENDSQQECQDILDSVEDLIKDYNKRASGLPYHNPSLTSSGEVIPQVDGSDDDPCLSPCAGSAGNTSVTEMDTQSNRSSQHQVLQDKAENYSGNHKERKSLWGSIPFSVSPRVHNHSGSFASDINNTLLAGTKDAPGPSFSAGNAMVIKDSDFMQTSEANIYDTKGGSALVGCSVRDLMRRKRCYRVEPPESSRIKRILLEGDHQEDMYLCPKQLNFDVSQSEDHGTPNINSPLIDMHSEMGKSFQTDSLTLEREVGDITGSRKVSLTEPNPLHAGRREPSQLLKPYTQDVAVSMDHSDSNKGKDAKTSARVVQNVNQSCSEGFQNTSVGYGLLESMYINNEAKSLIVAATTVCKKSTTADKADLDENASVLGTIRNYHLVEENHKGISGQSPVELLPFFVLDSQETEVENKCLNNDECSFHQEASVNVPTHYLNDSSQLYVLTPLCPPPSVDSVQKWLLSDGKGDSEESKEVPVEVACSSNGLSSRSIGSQGYFPNIGNKAPEADFGSHVRKILQSDGNTVKVLKASTDCSQDASQISGPTGKSRSTPLSQIGFRDPASYGCGQQLTLLSIEIHAESRGDLRPDPRFDAVNVIALAVQSDSDSVAEVHALIHCKTEPCVRNLDAVSCCSMIVFSEERQLLSHFMETVCSFDPDMIMGWDIQGGSLGFLAERASHLGIGLLNSISRTPSKSKIATGYSDISDKVLPDAVQPDPLVTDSTIIGDAIIEDEWGRTHASGVHVGGRVVLNVWRLMRSELKLKMYTVEAIAEAVLRQKVPMFQYKVLTKWFSSGSGRARHRCIDYVVNRAKLNLQIMNQLDMINRTSELARVFGIDFFSVLSRGSQYRVESMFLRLAHTQNYLAISPGNQQVASQPAMECIPLVMEPASGFYADPVVVLDFQSLYPSMIIAYNLCFCTCLGNVAPSKAGTLGVSLYSPDSRVLRDLRKQVLLMPNGVMYAPTEVRKGVLPRLLEEILSTRIMVKQAIKKLAPSQQVLHRIFDARQLALKLIANVTYGYTAAGFSGRMPCAELADSIVQCGRRTLENAISLVNAHDKWNAEVIYGDTDSMFVLLKGRTVNEAFQIGQEIASAVTAMNPNPVTLKMEKVYQPCFLLTKKRYVGYSYGSPDQKEPVFDAKGIETVRRDTCEAVAKTMEQSLRIFFEHQDISKVKTYLVRQWTRIISGRVSLQDFVFAKEVRLGTYSTRASSLPPGAIVASKAMRADPRAEPRYGERIPYVVIHGEPGARLVDMVVDPLDMLTINSPFRLNDLYYISKQINRALQRVFGLVGADLNNWFLEMPRPVRDGFTKCPFPAPNPHRTRIDYYYLSKHCILCGELVQASSHICNDCSQNDTVVATAVTGKTSKLEREMQHLAAICGHCGGGDWVVESGIKCKSLACSVFFERLKVQKELLGLSIVAADKGFYPKCNVEWF